MRKLAGGLAIMVWICGAHSQVAPEVPRLLSASTLGNPNGVYLRFSKSLDAATALNPASYQLSHGLRVTGAAFGSNQTLVVLTTDPFTADTILYTLTVSGVLDIEMPARLISPNPTFGQFRHGTEYPSFRILYKKFDNIPDTVLATLFASPKFPNAPDLVRTDLLEFETPTNVDDNYGAQLLGFYVAPLTGNYRFWMASDDQGATYLSTDAAPAHKVQIAAEPSWAARRAYLDEADRGFPPSNVSAPIPLLAGQKVYLEAVFKEGGGGDNLAVAVQLPGASSPGNGDPPILASQFTSTRQGPDGRYFFVLGPVVITQQPAATTAQEGVRVTFATEVDGTPPYALQWTRNSTPIPGANATSYTTPPLTLADHGAVYRLVVSNPFSSAFSSNAPLTVLPNPRVVSVSNRGLPDRVYVVFNKPVAISPGSGAGYSLDGGVAIHDQAYGASQSEVVLSTDPLTTGLRYTLTVQGVTDQEAPPHTILPNPTQISFVPGSGRFLADFNSETPRGAHLFGSAFVSAAGGRDGSGVLKVTPTAANRQGSLLIDDLNSGAPVDHFTATFKAYVGGGVFAAEGFSFIFADDLIDEAWGEAGAGSGLIVSFDSSADGGEVPGVEVLWQGASMARVPRAISGGNAGTNFVDVLIHLDPDGTLDITYGGYIIVSNLTIPYTPITAGRFGLGARTSAEDQSDNHWIDDLLITTIGSGGAAVIAVQPSSQSVPEGLRASFRVAPDGTPPFSYQWFRNGLPIPNATSWSYTTPPLTVADHGAVFSIVVSNALGGAISSSAVLTTTTPVLLSPFLSTTNIGDALPPGRFVVNGPGTFTIEAGGNDIWDAADQGFFVYAPVEGDFDVRVRVQSLEAVNTWTKAGLMVRETLEPDSRMAFIRATPPAVPVDVEGSQPGANDIRLGFRTGIPGLGANGGQNEHGGGAPNYPNAWLRLARAGHLLRSFNSTNGVNWINGVTLDTSLWQGGALPPPLLLGLAVSANAQSRSAVAEFGELSDTVSRAPVILQQPIDQTVVVGQQTTFTIQLDGFYDPTRALQWFANNVPVPGANGLTFTTAPAALAQDGTVVRAEIASASGSVVSRNAVWHVTAAPALFSAASRGDPNGVYLQFSEPLDPGSALNPAHYQVSGGITVSNVDFGSNQTLVRLSTSALRDDTHYTVTVSNVRDQDVPPLALFPNPSLTGFTHGQEFSGFRITMKKYGGSGAPISGAYSLATLTNHPSFPDAPTAVSHPAQFEIPVDRDDFYGAVLSGFYVAPFTGTYKFYMCSDDVGATYLSTDADPAHKVLIAAEPQWNGSREYVNGSNPLPSRGNPPANISAPIELVGGQKVYLEAMFIEVAGGDNLSVAVQLPGGPPPSTPVDGSFFTRQRALGETEFSAFGPVVFLTQPTNSIALEGRRATLTAGVDGTPPYSAQWFSNGVAIPGANQLRYITPPLLPATAFDGVAYRLFVSNEFSGVLSSNAVLSVLADTEPPTLVGAAGDASFGRATVTFSEPVTPAEATNLANYSITNRVGTPLAISSALLINGTNVVLTTARQAEGSNYVVTVNGITDVSLAGNVIASHSQIAFTAWVFSRGFAKREQYYNVSGYAVSDLRVAAKYPDAPDEVDYTTFLEYPFTVFGPLGGVRISGFLVPPVSGPFHFFMASERHGEFWLSPDDDPEHLLLIATEPDWATARDWTSSVRRNPAALQNRSSTLFPAGIPLMAGQRYYFEALMKAPYQLGYLGATWQKPGEPLPVSAPPIPGAYMGTFANPDTAGELTITEQPASQTVFENQNVTFRVTANYSPDGPIAYEWLLNGTPIPDSDEAAYTTPPLGTNHSGDRYRCRVSIVGRTLLSDEAVLSVLADTMPPELLAVASISNRSVTLCFSERMNAGSVLNPAHYLVNGGAVGVNSVVLLPDGRSIVVTLDAPLTGLFSVRVTNLFDMAMNPITGAPTLDGQAVFTGLDVGAPAPPGSSFTCNNTDFDVIAGGPFIFNAYDDFHFVYTKRTNNFDVKVKVTRRDAVSQCSNAGLMARESLAPESRFLYEGTAENWRVGGTVLAWRRTAFQGLADLWSSSNIDAPFPIWLRLKRVGSEWSGYWGTNGYDWTPFAAASQSMSNVLCVGMAAVICSENLAQSMRVEFRQFIDVAYANVSVTVTQQPANATVSANGSVTFIVAGQVTGAPPEELGYQWQRNGVDILGANSPTYITPPLTLDDSGVTAFRALLFVSGATTATSAVARVTVNPAETMAPTLLRASVDPNDSTRVVLVFNEPLLPSSVTNSANFAINGANVLAAAPFGIAAVVLNVAGLTNCFQPGAFVAQAIGVRDAHGNFIVPGAQADLFVGPLPILFVVNQPGNLNAADTFVLERLHSQGYVADVVGQNASTNDANGVGLVLISATVQANNFQGRFTSVPVLTWNSGLYSHLRFAPEGLFGTTGADRLKITADGHSLAEGVVPGVYDITPQIINVCRPAGDPIIAATDLLNRAAVFAFEAGAPMAFESPAPARRIGFFWDENAAANANAVELALFDAAVLWGQSPVFVQQPESQTVSPGATVTFCVRVASPTPPSYQWRLNGANIPGATGPTLTLANVQPKDGGSYSVVAVNEVDAVTSDVADLVVLSPALAFTDNFVNAPGALSASFTGRGNNNFASPQPGEPLHVGKPGGHSVWYSWQAIEDGIVTFSTRGSGFDTLLGIYTGSDVDSLVEVASDEDNGGFFTSKASFNARASTTYHVAVDGLAGARGNIVLSWQFIPTAQLLPRITSQPLSQSLFAGQTALFSVGVNSATPVIYQWLFGDQPIAGATNNTLTISNAQPADVGAYRAVVINASGLSAISAEAFLEIGPVTRIVSRDKPEDLFPELLASGGGFLPASLPAGFISVSLGSIDSQTLDNRSATTQPAEPNHCGVLGGASQWLRLRPATDATLLIDTFGSAIDTVLAVYRPTNLFNLAAGLVTCDDNGAPDGRRSLVRFDARAMTDYLVAVDGVNAARGRINLNWKLGRAPVLLPSSSLPPLVSQGGAVLLSINISNSFGAGFQWLLNDRLLAGATNATLLLNNITLGMAGTYSTIVSNFAGMATNVQTVTVEVPYLRAGTLLPNGLFRVWLPGSNAPSFAIESSPHLSSPTWLLIQTIGPTNTVPYLDLPAPNPPGQFYRARPWP